MLVDSFGAAAAEVRNDMRIAANLPPIDWMGDVIEAKPAQVAA